MQASVGEAAWGRELGERLVWMASQGAQRAELRLNPPQLGPLEIQLSLKRDEASVSFVSHHGAVRDAVEAALPRLRELLGAQGFDLVDVDVSAGGGEREGASETPGGRGGAGTAASGDPAEAGTGATPASLLGGVGLVDTFA
jgi:flagellar hook-length control protein FliK